MYRLGLLDGDVLVYQCGFASDATAKAAYISSHGSDEGFDIKQHHEPLRYTLHGVREKIKSILKATDSHDHQVFVSHPVNYREQFYPPYKMNRDTSHKPYWYDDIKGYLIDREPTVISEQGDEADDAMGIAQCSAAENKSIETIICTIDKDLNMIPGLHYNFSKNNISKGVYSMDDPECLALFYGQIIKGDSSDNIPGLFRKTGRKAEARYFYPLEGMKNETDMYNYVLDLFDGDVEHVRLMSKLLWIKRDSRWHDEYSRGEE